MADDPTPAADPTPAPNPAPKTMNVTQDDIQGFIDKGYERGAKNSVDAKKVAAMDAELQEFRKAKTDAEAAAAAAPEANGADKEALETLRTQITAEYDKKILEIESDRDQVKEKAAASETEYLRKDLSRQVISAAAKAGAKDAEDVYTLIEATGIFDLDDESKSWIVKDPKSGKMRIDVENNAEPLSIDKAVAEFLDAKPHLKRSSGRTGSGQGPGNQPGSEAPSGGLDLKGMTPTEIYQKRHQILDQIGVVRRGS